MRTFYQPKDFDAIERALQLKGTQISSDLGSTRYEFFERIFTIIYTNNQITKIYSDPKP